MKLEEINTEETPKPTFAASNYLIVRCDVLCVKLHEEIDKHFSVDIHLVEEVIFLSFDCY